MGGDTGSGRGDSLNLRNLSEELAAATADEEDGDAPSMPAGPQWRLREQGNQLVGTRNGQPMQLRRVRPASGMMFGVRRFTTEVLPRPDHPEDSVSGRISMQALVPASGQYQNDIAAHIRRGLHGDTLDTALAPPLDSIWQEHVRLFTRDYRADAAPLLAAKKTSTDYQPVAALAYEQEANSYVLWNQGDLLSLGFFGYDYSGGAHGMYGTYVQSYDLRTGRALHYDDIFRAGTKPQLAKLLAQYARPVLGLKDNEPLSGALQVKTLPVTRNVYLTSGGAVFVYLPYEVAAFSYGQISVFVPYSDLQPLLKPGLPVGGGSAAVANR